MLRRLTESLVSSLYGLHGPLYHLIWDDPIRRNAILHIARLTERDPVLSPHIMAVAYRGTALEPRMNTDEHG